MLPPLRVCGREIVNTFTSEPVRLRGVNLSGLEYSPSLSAAGITFEELDEIVLGWQANVVRVPINQTWALQSTAYLAELDLLIAEISRRGAYILLDLQWIDAQTQRGTNADGTPNYVPALPDCDSSRTWRQLAARYCGEPSVLYDIFNEPHDPLPDDSTPLLGIDGGGRTFTLRKRVVDMRVWRPWAVHLVRSIRAEHPEGLIFVSGVNWGYDLRGFPLENIEGVVYSTHVYPNKGSNWRGAFGDLSHRYPVFVAEFGGNDQDVGWGESLLQYFDSLSVGWAAWSWADRPHLVSAEFEPTAFGSIVRGALRS